MYTKAASTNPQSTILPSKAAQADDTLKMNGVVVAELLAMYEIEKSSARIPTSRAIIANKAPPTIP